MSKHYFEKSTGQRGMTQKVFFKLTPKAQGYWSYIQAAWNMVIPGTCIYKAGSWKAKQWEAGEQEAMQDSQQAIAGTSRIATGERA